MEAEAAVGEGWKRSKSVRKKTTTQKSAVAEAPVRDNQGHPSFEDSGNKSSYYVITLWLSRELK